MGGRSCCSFVRWCSISCALFARRSLAQAQNAASYPDRPIRLVVAFPPGGATDTLRPPDHARAWGSARPVRRDREQAAAPAATSPGTTSRRSDPDGYTLLMAENALGISQALYKKTQSLRPAEAIRRHRRGGILAAGAIGRQQRQGQLGGGAHRLFEDGAAEDELRLGGHRQRVAPDLRGARIGDRHGGGARSLQGRRSGGERCDRRARRAQYGVASRSRRA